MKHIVRYGILLALLLTLAVDALRAAVTVTIEDYVCYGGDYVWVHDGVERTSFTNVTGNKSYTYYSEKDGCNYKLSLKYLRGTKSNTQARINIANHETYTWSVNGKTYDTPGVYLDTIYFVEEGLPDCIKEIRGLLLSGDTASFYCKGTTYVWDRFPEKTTTSTSTTLSVQESVVVSVAGSSSTWKATWYNKVTRKDPTSSTTTVIIDNGESYEWFGKSYYGTGTYYDTIFGGNMYGCDSIGVLELTVKPYCPPDDYVEVVNVTAIGEYYWSVTDMTYTTNTTINKDVTNEFGCTSHYQLNLTIYPKPTVDSDTAATICKGDSFEWYHVSYSEPGQYYRADVGKTLHLGVLPIPHVYVCGTQYIDQGHSAPISATGTDYYVWEPNNTLSSPWADSPTASPDVSTTYYVKGYTSSTGNLVRNGDFENGYADFETDLIKPRTSTQKYGTYVITNNPSACTGEDALWNDWGSYKDHTYANGSGKYMVVDGFDQLNKIIWQQTVTVVPGNDYIFSAWFISLKTALADGTTTAKLQFFVNGEQLGEVREAPKKGGEWGRYYEQWSSGTETTATLTIMNQNKDGKGNDFGLDDISFQALGPCYAYESVDVVVNRYFDKDTTLYRSQLATATWEEHALTHEGDYQHRYMSAETGYADSVMVLHVSVLNDYPVDVYADCSATVEQRLQGESPTQTFTLHIAGKDGCTSTHVGQYRTGDIVLLTAHTEDCYRFVGWSDGETSPVRVVTMDADDELTAIYEPLRYTVRVNYNLSQGIINTQY